MRRVQIHIEDEMDDSLAREARRRGLTKAAFIRLLLSQHQISDDPDPIDALIGAGRGEAAVDIDAIIYDR